MLSNLIVMAKEFVSRMGARQQKGQGLIEYALIVLLIAIAVLVVLGLVGGQVKTVFQEIVDGLSPTPIP